MSNFSEFFCWWNETPATAKERSSLADQSFDTTYISLVAYPILLLACTLGNSMNIIILSRLAKIKVKEIILFSLAISDLSVL
jgi:hypothetical protein